MKFLFSFAFLGISCSAALASASLQSNQIIHDDNFKIVKYLRERIRKKIDGKLEDEGFQDETIFNNSKKSMPSNVSSSLESNKSNLLPNPQTPSSVTNKSLDVSADNLKNIVSTKIQAKIADVKKNQKIESKAQKIQTKNVKQTPDPPKISLTVVSKPTTTTATLPTAQIASSSLSSTVTKNQITTDSRATTTTLVPQKSIPITITPSIQSQTKTVVPINKNTVTGSSTNAIALNNDKILPLPTPIPLPTSNTPPKTSISQPDSSVVVSLNQVSQPLTPAVVLPKADNNTPSLSQSNQVDSSASASKSAANTNSILASLKSQGSTSLSYIPDPIPAVQKINPIQNTKIQKIIISNEPTTSVNKTLQNQDTYLRSLNSLASTTLYFEPQQSASKPIK